MVIKLFHSFCWYDYVHKKRQFEAVFTRDLATETFGESPVSHLDWTMGTNFH